MLSARRYRGKSCLLIDLDDSCPDMPNQQIQRLLAAFPEQLEGNLIGIYLHGSLALGCFNPITSDIDLLVLTRHKISLCTKSDRPGFGRPCYCDQASGDLFVGRTD